MESQANESWVYTLGKTELRRLTNPFYINASGVAPILREVRTKYAHRPKN